ncbi:MAG: glutathione S-transferase family protein [Leucothrix sp.]
MLTLYQFNSCPFCWKVRSLLNYANQPYETVEVNPMGMKGLEFTDHKKVPVLKDGSKVIVESATIVDYINDNYAHAPKSPDSKTWTDWVDETLVHYLPALIHPNFMTSWRNFGEIMQAEQYPWYKAIVVRLGGSLVMPKVSKRLKKKHGIDNTEAEFLTAIEHWASNGLADKPFYGGEQPDFVDCSVFGVLRSGDKLGVVKTAKNSNEAFAAWYDRCYPIMSKHG